MGTSSERGGRNRRPRRKNTHDFWCVGIGASAGGIKAVEQFLERLPSNSNMAFVIILHLSPQHESNLASLFQRRTNMPVIQVVETVKVEPNHVYVIPPANHLFMEDGYIRLREPEAQKGKRVPIDLFFRTLAEAYSVHSIGVVLTGTGTDGTLGLRRIKEEGGIALAQDPQEAEYDGMPRSAINAGLVDFILPIEEIADKIIAVRQASEKIQLPPEGDRAPKGVEAESLREILTLLRVRTGHDFNSYKRSTVLRRITRRMQVNELEELALYLRYIREHPHEVQDLMHDLLITVTNFFRDSEAFEVLERQVVPLLFAEKREGEQVRTWVTGCATGEEAYSLAILMQEEAQRLDQTPNIQIFATDIDDDSIISAREGLFPETISADVSPERLKRFFNKEGQYYRVKKEIRESVLFAGHNILRDPPFSRLDLVSCRNLLIYLNRDTQERVLELFHFALRPNGFLFLGASESADSLPELFTPVDKKFRIFKRSAVVPSTAYVPAMPVTGKWDVKLPDVSAAARKSFSYGELHQLLLEQYAPPSVLITEGYDIVHLSEKAGRYLRFPGGEPSRNLLKAIHPDLRLDLRAALYTVTQDETIENVTRPLSIRLDGQERQISVTVRRITIPEVARGYLLIIFDEGDPATAPAVVQSGDVAARAGTDTNDLEVVQRRLEE